MSRVNTALAFGAASLVAAALLAVTATDADAKRLRLRPAAIVVPGVGSSAASKAQADTLAATDDAMPAKTYLSASDKPTVADADATRSKGELARMRAERALTENGEKPKVEDEEVIGKDDVDPDDAPATAGAGKGERVVVKPANKIVCIAGCN